MQQCPKKRCRRKKSSGKEGAIWSYGYSHSLNGELRSYQEFPNHTLDIISGQFHDRSLNMIKKHCYVICSLVFGFYGVSRCHTLIDYTRYCSKSDFRHEEGWEAWVVLCYILIMSNGTIDMWRFPEIGVPLVIILILVGFSLINHPSGGSPMTMEPYVSNKFRRCHSIL